MESRIHKLKCRILSLETRMQDPGSTNGDLKSRIYSPEFKIQNAGTRIHEPEFKSHKQKSVIRGSEVNEAEARLESGIHSPELRIQKPEPYNSELRIHEAKSIIKNFECRSRIQTQKPRHDGI